MMHGRLPWLGPDDLDPEQREFYDKVLSSPRANATRPTPLVDSEGRFNGPFNAMLTNPALGSAIQAIGVALRFPGNLPRLTFEAIVLMVSVERGAAYEWYAHAPLALRSGMDATQLTAILERRDSDIETLLDPQLIELVRATLRHEQPSEESVRAVESLYGASGVTEVAMTVAFYDMIATLMRTWDSPLPEGVPDPFH